MKSIKNEFSKGTGNYKAEPKFLLSTFDAKPRIKVYNFGGDNLGEGPKTNRRLQSFWIIGGTPDKWINVP